MIMDKDCRYCTYSKGGYCHYNSNSMHLEERERTNKLMQFLLGSKIVEASGARFPECRCCIKFKTDPGKELLYMTDNAWTFGTYRRKGIPRGKGIIDQIKYIEGHKWEEKENKTI